MKFSTSIVVGVATIVCCFSVASADLKQGLRGVFLYTYDESFSGADLQVQELDSKVLEKLFASKDFVSKPKPLSNSYEFLALLDGRCDLQVKCEKKECAKSVDKSCPAKEICPSCQKCESCTSPSCPACPKAETCGKTLAPVTTTTPKPAPTTTKPKPVPTTTKPKPVPTTTKPKPVPTTTKPKPGPTTTAARKLTTQAPTYLPPVETTPPPTYLPPVPEFKCTSATSNDPRCLKPEPPFSCTAATANDPRCAKPTPPPFTCTAATANDPRCAKPTPPPFTCTAATAKDPRCAKPTPPPFACTAATAKDPRCAKPTPPPFSCTAATANDPRCIKPTTPRIPTTTKYSAPTYIPQRVPIGTTREPWTGTYVINTGTFRQSHTWVPFVAPGTYKTRKPGTYGTITTTPKYNRNAPANGIQYAS